MRMNRGFVLAVAALSSALVLVGCARDTGSGSGSTPSGSNAAACATGTAPAGGGAAATIAPPPTANASALKVGLAFDIGGRDDKSFNASAGAGIDKAVADLQLVQENTKELTAAPNESPDAAATRLRQLVADGFNPIIAVGFKYATPLETVAKENPQVKFALVDGATEASLPNVTPLLFAEEQGSFLVGAAAALKTKSCHIGFVGGVEVPLIKKFEAGYVAGAKAVAPNIKIESDYLTPAGDFTGFQDPAKGNVVAKGQLDKGADIVYHAAGASGNGVFEAVDAANKAAPEKWGIGVDSDQYNTVTPPLNEIILTSMLKRVDVAVFSYIAAVANGDTSVIPKAFDLKVDGVGYSTSGNKIADLTSKLDAYKDAIISGGITVPDKP